MVDSSGNLPLCSWHSDDYHRTQVNLNMLEEECHRRPFKQRIPSLFDVAFNMKIYSVSKPLPYLPNTKISASVHILLRCNVFPLRGRPSPKFCTSVPIRSPKRNVRCLSLSSFSVRLICSRDKPSFMKKMKSWSSWDTFQSLTHQHSIRASLTAVLRLTLALKEQTPGNSCLDDWCDVYRKAIDCDIRNVERILLQLINDVGDTFIGTIFTLLPSSAINNFMNILQTVRIFVIPLRLVANYICLSGR